MKISTIKCIISSLCVILFLTNCGGDTENNGPTLSVQPASITLEADGTGQSITVSSNTSWTVRADDSWLKYSPTGGTGGSSITVSASYNTGEERISKLTLTDKTGRATAEVRVTQKKAESPTPTPNPDQTLTVNPTSLNFNSSAGSNTFSIESNTSWTVKSDQTWCTVNTASGSNNATVTVNVTENTSTIARNAAITVSYGNSSVKMVSIIVNQNAASVNDEISASMTSLDFASEGGSQTVTITSNFPWETISKPSWITISPTSGSSGTTNLTITAEKTNSTSSRTGDIKLGKSATVSISVTQAASSELTANVTSLSFSADGGTKNISIKALSSWGINKIPSWITLSQTKGSKGDTNIEIRVSKSTSNSPREGTIAFGIGYDEDNLEITISQDAAKSSYTESDRSYIVTGNGKTVNFKMKYVQAGTFTMGQCRISNHYIHSVTLTNDYYIGETEVTQALWYAVMGKSPTDDIYKWESIYGIGDNYPAYFLNYNDCLDFISRLNALLGEKFRLPTEAEWEYAAFGGNKSQGYTYAGGNIIGDVAWYKENSNSYKPVATKKANELGIYDMSGNADEWCFDWYGDYDTNEQINPTGPVSGEYRVIRGGEWVNGEYSCRIQERSYSKPDRQGSGLRLALTK